MPAVKLIQYIGEVVYAFADPRRSIAVKDHDRVLIDIVMAVGKAARRFPKIARHGTKLLRFHQTILRAARIARCPTLVQRNDLFFYMAFCPALQRDV